VTLEADAALGEVPKDLGAVLKKTVATAGFAALSFTYRKEHVRAIGKAKAPETRAQRIAKAVDVALAKRA
jgi:uncharacterized protein YdeI (YjbR/CyaY-like superfamily)